MIQRTCLMVVVVSVLCGLGTPANSKAVKNWYLTESAKVPGTTFFRGMTVTGTVENSPAHRQLERGDVIIRINKQATNRFSEYDRALRDSDGIANLRVRRGAGYIEIRIELQ